MKVRPYHKTKKYYKKMDKPRYGAIKSVHLDSMILAKPAGKRKSKAGNVYYEYRRNRSDVKPFWNI